MGAPTPVSGCQATAVSRVKSRIIITVVRTVFFSSYALFSLSDAGKRHGVGTLVFDGGIFEGQWARGEASGSGLVA